MRRFTKNIILCFIAVVFFISANAIINLTFFNTRKYVVSKAYNTLLMGDCRMRNGVNPRLIDSAVNIAQRGERIEFTYLKLKRILEDNQDVKKVLLSYPSLYDIDIQILNAPLDERYYDVVDFKFSSVLDNEISFLLLLKGYGLFPRYKKQNKWVGEGYVSLGKKSITPQEKSMKYDVKEKRENIFAWAMLDSIVTLCAQKKVDLYLVQVPVFFLNEIDADQELQYEKIEKRYQSANIFHLITQSPLVNKEEMFADMLHLNEKGSNFYSSWLNSQIRR